MHFEDYVCLKLQCCILLFGTNFNLYLIQALELREGDKDCLVARSRCYLLIGDADTALKDAELSLAESDKYWKVCLKTLLFENMNFPFQALPFEEYVAKLQLTFAQESFIFSQSSCKVM